MKFSKLEKGYALLFISVLILGDGIGLFPIPISFKRVESFLELFIFAGSIIALYVSVKYLKAGYKERKKNN